MAASAEQNEIIELTDLIEKGPDLPKNSPKTPEPLPLPDEAPATAAPAPDDLLLLPVQDHEPVPSPAPAVEDVPPARDWEAQLDASAAPCIGRKLRSAIRACIWPLWQRRPAPKAPCCRKAWSASAAWKKAAASSTVA